jgi:hypothetical protein
MNEHNTRSDEIANVRTASAWRGLWQRGLYASAGAAAVNAGLYITAVALGIFPSLHLLGSATPQPALVTVLIVSCVATLVCTALFRLFAMRTKHPFFLLGALAIAVLVFSFLPVTARTDWSRAQVAMVELMHITVATAIVTALWGWQRMQQRNQY